MSADCPKCFREVRAVVPVNGSQPVGGRVGWWCDNCEALYPDSDYVEMRKRPLGMPHE
jgi:hypothetical protein